MRCKSGSEIELGVAERVEISSDGKTYRFYLKKTFWTDGHPVIAYDFENSWKTILKPNFPSLCAYLLYPIKNAEKYAKGLCEEALVGIYSQDAQTLIVELENPSPYFLALTAFPLYMPTPSHLKDSPSYWAEKDPLNVVCNGPFSLDVVKPGSEILLKKNTSFWNKSQILLDQIHISIIGSDLTAIQLFEKGELDLIGGSLFSLSPEIFPEMKNDDRLQYFPMAASTFCTLNTKSFPFHNQHLRTAFQKAAQNHPYLQKEIEYNGHIPAKNALPPSLSTLDSRNEDISAPNGVQDLLKKGCEELQIETEKLEELTLYYKPNSIEKKFAQTLQKIWAETLGISIQIKQIETKSLIEKLYAKDYEIAITSWIAQFHDPINLLERFKDPTHSKNYPGWSSSNYQNLLHEIAISNGPLRRQLIQEAEKILEEANIIIPLYHWKSPTLLQSRVQGLEVTDSGGILIEKCRLEPNQPRM